MKQDLNIYRVSSTEASATELKKTILNMLPRTPYACLYQFFSCGWYLSALWHCVHFIHIMIPLHINTAADAAACYCSELECINCRIVIDKNNFLCIYAIIIFHFVASTVIFFLLL